MNLPLSTAFIVSHRFWVVVFSFEKINKIDKPLASSLRNKGRRTKSTKLEMKMERSQQTTLKYKGS